MNKKVKLPFLGVVSAKDDRMIEKKLYEWATNNDGRGAVVHTLYVQKEDDDVTVIHEETDEDGGVVSQEEWHLG